MLRRPIGTPASSGWARSCVVSSASQSTPNARSAPGAARTARSEPNCPKISGSSASANPQRFTGARQPCLRRPRGTARDNRVVVCRSGIQMGSCSWRHLPEHRRCREARCGSHLQRITLSDRVRHHAGTIPEALHRPYIRGCRRMSPNVAPCRPLSVDFGHAPAFSDASCTSGCSNHIGRRPRPLRGCGRRCFQDGGVHAVCGSPGRALAGFVPDS